MRDKKKSGSGKTPEREALEKHVDAMMDPKRSDKISLTETATPPPAEQSAPATTAPQLSPKLRKQIAVTETLTKRPPAAKRKPQEEKPETPEPAPVEDTPAPEEDITERSAELDDVRTDEAVDDIMAYESDVVLAVADSTAAEHNRQLAEPAEKKGHPVFSMLFWTLVTAMVLLIIVLSVLLVMGDSLANKLGV